MKKIRKRIFIVYWESLMLKMKLLFLPVLSVQGSVANGSVVAPLRVGSDPVESHVSRGGNRCKPGDTAQLLAAISKLSFILFI